MPEVARRPPAGSPVARFLDAAFFALVGIAFFAWWVVADPSREVSETQDEWPYVLAFSGVILLLGLALPLYARLVGGSFAFRAGLVVAGGAALGAVANVFEDGLHMDRVFVVFAASAFIMSVGLLAVAVSLASRQRGAHRLLALVPAGTLAAIIFAVEVGGPLMLATWLGAAAVALALPARTAA